MDLSRLTRSPVQIAGAAAAVLLLLAAVWWVRRPGPLRTPDRIGSLQRESDGIAGDVEGGLRDLAEQERRIDDPVVAVYGDPAEALPTVAVVAGVIKIGHGDEIVASMANGLAVGGVRVEPAKPADGGRRRGGFACGEISAGRLSGTYCTWHDRRTVGAIVVYGRESAAAARLAIEVRDAVER